MKIFKRILKYTKSYRLLISISIFFSIIYVILNSASIWLIGTMLGNIMNPTTKIIENPASINDYFNHFIQKLIGSGTSIEQLKMLCILLTSIFIIKNTLFYISNTIISYIQNKVITKIRIKLFKHISTLSLSFFNNTKTAELNSILIRDIGNMRIAFSQSLQKLIVEPMSIISFILLLLIINVKFSLLVITIIPISGFFSYKIGQSIRRKSKRSSIQIASVMNIIKETLSNIKIVKIFNTQKKENEKFKNEINKYFNLIFRQAKLSNLLTPINELIGLLVGILIIWFGGLNVLENQSMSSEDFIKFILLLFAMMQPIRKLANVNALFQNGIAAAERAFNIFDTKNIITESKEAIKLNTFKSSIIFDNVSFKYQNDSDNILNQINTKIKKGQTIAIVGKSGAGKSTFSELIPRLYDVQKGEVLIDDINIKNYTLKSLRGMIGIVTQNVILFNDTIKNNILIGDPSASEETLIKVAKIANVHDFINSLPEKYMTNIGDGGNKLSGGQKQRLAIARAIIKNPPILILDEATSSLDSESEKSVQIALKNVMKNRTSIIIAHRLSTISDVDKIVVMEKGEILETGTHKELLKTNSNYKKLVEIQSF
jgi:subfamily B ATP-binding cassette protein MsbA